MAIHAENYCLCARDSRFTISTWTVEGANTSIKLYTQTGCSFYLVTQDTAEASAVIEEYNRQARAAAASVVTNEEWGSEITFVYESSFFPGCYQKNTNSSYFP